APSTRKFEESTDTPIRPPPTRTKLTSEDVKLLAEKMRLEFGWESEPRNFQIEGTRAQLEGTDMIIQAPTGCGKTAVAAGPHVWPSSEGKITIVISPLLALEEEMVHTFARDFKLSAIAVHNKNGGCSWSTAQKLLSDSYQILLVSPEMIQSHTFINRVLRNPKFSRRVLSIVVDEAHCISHWGADFRKKYASLGIVRAFLPCNTPVIAMTATLTARARRDIHTFSKGHSRFINIGNDRPNVSVVVHSCEHPQNCYADLDFVIPATVNALSDIPKTWVYVDNIATGNEIIDHLENILLSRITSTDRLGDNCSGAIRPFNAVLSLSYRRAAMEAFREGKIRVMVCTDAAGMGCDIPDVEVVVQWMLPKTFSNWIQRAGRAARGRGRKGLAVLIVAPAIYKKVIDSSLNVNGRGSSGGPGTGKGKGSKKEKERCITPEEYAILHGANRGKRDKQDQQPAARQPPFDEESDDEGLTVFVQSTRCRREVWAQAFDTQFDPLTVPCCDICDPSLFDRTRPGDRPQPSVKAKGPKGRKRGQAIPEVEKRLRQWRRMVYQRDHDFAVYEAKSLLNDDMVAVLASHGDLKLQTFNRLLSGSWIWWERYGTELQEFMKEL
ncbi:P-loop containing nucleoside triphosphate hydrolase protein, partial [Panus rudis PR-1116 ss-1]